MKKTGLWIVLLLALASSMHLYAQGHRERRGHDDRTYLQGRGSEEGMGGASGQITAWLLAIANFPVVCSVLLKAAAKVAPENAKFGEAVARTNRKQKQYFIKLHYWLNPIAIGVAIVHFLLTKCDGTAIPELGLGFMLLVCILGLVLTFRLFSPSFRKAILKIHTSPIVLAASIAILLIGHSLVD